MSYVYTVIGSLYKPTPLFKVQIRPVLFTSSILYGCMSMICSRYTDEGVVGSVMGLFMIVGHWPKILPQNLEGAN
jgi:hypothetical protein